MPRNGWLSCVVCVVSIKMRRRSDVSMSETIDGDVYADLVEESWFEAGELEIALMAEVLGMVITVSRCAWVAGRDGKPKSGWRRVGLRQGSERSHSSNWRAKLST